VQHSAEGYSTESDTSWTSLLVVLTSAILIYPFGIARHAIGHAPPIRLACRGSLDPVLEGFGMSGVGRVSAWLTLDVAEAP
jgi:hypothetical protein